MRQSEHLHALPVLRRVSRQLFHRRGQIFDRARVIGFLVIAQSEQIFNFVIFGIAFGLAQQHFQRRVCLPRSTVRTPA